MIVGRTKHVLRAPKGEADGDGGAGLDIQEDDIDDDGGADDDTVEGSDGADKPDRGDEVEPKLDPKALAKVAGEAGDDTVEGGEDTTAAADGEDTTAGGKKGSTSVPIGRFNEVNEQMKRLRDENEALKAGKPAATPPPPAPEPFNMKKSERQYAELLADGKFDEAADLRTEINGHIQAQAEANVETRQAQRTVTQSLGAVAAQAVKDFPYLDTDDGEEVMAMIVAARDAGIKKGVAPAEALKAAVAKIAPKFAPEGGAGAAATPSKELQGGKGGTDTRTQEAAKRGAQASTQQPPVATGGAGNRATAGKTVDVEDMTDAQFDALTPAEKSRLRGDS